jgi:mono/diheme cytochrome c family protein
MFRSNHRTVALATAVIAGVTLASATADAASQRQIDRGKYLVKISGCADCHTPGYLLGKPDTAHPLSGSDVGVEMPGLGVFVGSNLTPDKDTGLGTWNRKQIVTAITTGKRPDGRELSPAMPWRDLANLKRRDANAIADYLMSLEPVSHEVAGPFGANEKPTLPVRKIVMPEGQAAGASGATPPKQ